MQLILKAKAAAQGEAHTWSDGKTHKKVGKKWVVISGGQKTEQRQLSDAWRRGQQLFDYSMTTNLGDVIDDVLQRRGIGSYEELVDTIKAGSQDTAHRIFKEAVDEIRSATATTGDKRAAVDLFGRMLIILKDQYSTAPKTKLTIVKTTKTGKKYGVYPEGKHSTELPVMKPSRLKTEKSKMGGWSVTGELKTSHVRAMLKTKAAKLVSGKPDARKTWIMPKKAEDMNLKYTGDALTITVKQVVKKAKRTRATAKVEIKIPYSMAKAFLLNQIASTRTRNNFIFRMEHSQGYRNYMEKYAA